MLGQFKEDLLFTEKTAFLVEKTWWNNWKKYVNGGPPPGRPQNYNLLSGFEIKHNNGILINKESWDILKEIYDMKPEVEVFIIDKTPDFNPVNLNIRDPSNNEYKFYLVSTKLTIRDLIRHVSEKRNLRIDLKAYMDRAAVPLDDDRTLEAQGITGNGRLDFRGENYVHFEESRDNNSQRSNQNHPKCEIPKKPNIDIVRNMITQAIAQERQTIMVQSFEAVRSNIDEMLSNIDHLEI